MTFFELIAFVLILGLAFGGAWLLGAHFGPSGYILGFLAGAFLFPAGIWLLLKVLPKRKRR